MAVEQIRRVFCDNYVRDNFAYFSIKTYVAEAILMSTHNICFYGELTKIILQLSSTTLLICSTVWTHDFIAGSIGLGPTES